MPRDRGGRGGRRQGQPGKAYSNRTDLAQDRAPMNNPMEAQGRTPAAGEMGSTMPQDPFTHPGETPGLLDDPQFPGPVTDGAALGPGAGPEAITQTPEDEARALLKFLPAMERAANRDDSSLSFRNLVRYMRSL